MNEKELRDLDAWIAKNVFGWKPETRKMYAGENNVKGFGLNQHLGRGDCERKFINDYLFPLDRYSTDPAAAMQVLEKCAEKLAPQRLHIYAPTGACKIWLVSDCEGHNSTPSSGSAENLPEAICLFAQKLFSKP